MKCHRCKTADCYRNGRVCFENEKSLKELSPFEQKLLKVSSEVEKEFYCKLTRVEELLEFFRRMGFKKIGIAFCIGLTEETKTFAEILESAGFEVFSAACKVGAVDKSELNVEKLKPELPEAICNPVGQAEALNRAKTDVNVIIGLCVGHDMLFQLHSKAPVTTLIVKDRVLAHNPVGALYSKYYTKRLKKQLNWRDKARRSSLVLSFLEQLSQNFGSLFLASKPKGKSESKGKPEGEGEDHQLDHSRSYAKVR